MMIIIKPNYNRVIMTQIIIIPSSKTWSFLKALSNYTRIFNRPTTRNIASTFNLGKNSRHLEGVAEVGG